MVRTNLSSRPFYNEYVLRLALAIVGGLVVVATAVNVVQAVRLSGQQRTLGAHAAQSEAEAARLRTQAAAARRQINPKELESVAAAAREANAIIDQRAFSWTALFGHFEQSLPSDVRIVAVQPRQESDGRVMVTVSVQARRVEDLDAFVEALEKGGGFRKVLTLEEQTNTEGLLEAIVEGEYVGGPTRG
jgi:hypothetical protein